MRRRDLLIALCGTLVPWPEVASADERIHRIGVLAQDIEPGLMEAFRDQLQKVGYFEGGNVTIELRNADGRNELLPKLAEELVQKKSEVIVAVNTPAAQAAQKATDTVPIVMMRIADPVKSGIVTNLAKPGGNITGLSFMPDALGPKGVELLTQIYPNLKRMAALYQANNPGAVVIVDEVVRRGEPLGLQFVRLPVQSPNDYEQAFEMATRANTQALFVMDDGAITRRRQEILELASRHRLPVVSIYKDFAVSGGLIAYGPNLDVVYRRAADYVVNLLHGANPADTPIEQPVRFMVVINLKTAKTLGLDIPQSALILADEVIE
jgi:putative ABC transport system substrate-binding protein